MARTKQTARKSTSAVRIIFKGGDFLLRVTHDYKHERFYRVSSPALKLASPAWKNLTPVAMLPGMAQPGIIGMCSINANVAYDSGAMRILLLIAHLQFGEVPSTLDINTLVDLAKLCEDFQTKSLVLPYIERWTAALELPKTDGSSVEDWLRVGLTFECRSFLESVLHRIMTTLSVVEAKRLGDLPADLKGVNVCYKWFYLALTIFTGRMERSMLTRLKAIRLDIKRLTKSAQVPEFRCGEFGYREQDQDECALQRAGCIYVLSTKFETSGSHGTTRALESRALSNIETVVRTLVQRATRAISGVEHEHCGTSLAALAQRITEMCESANEFGPELEKLFKTEEQLD